MNIQPLQEVQCNPHAIVCNRRMHGFFACQGSSDSGGWNSRLAIGLHVGRLERWYAIAWVEAGQGAEQAA